ncbi:acyl-CoA dehydrogenase family protein [Nocardioides nitrophenolicus]|uniref:acyl-CoA dehydrogenase family protein n=1 Tax=Nocardioides nitrophenolicus TaxID=60489 RepID=UPI00195D0CB7|nr:acyl-CoA dehydrogenase family protein [Nocardioides nitrophenolicus]MBM7517540.1 alkylation response protein AidB-like acyl-CoA dehydrogenase [Nocardioides nitrophenolicus]
MTTPELVATPAAEAVDAADGHPFVQRVREYAERVLAPTALTTEVGGVTPERIEELRELGLLNHLAPREFGGHELDRAVDRRLHEILSGGCFNTWLVWAQHAPLAARIAAARAEGRSLPELALRILRGELLLGAAVSDVRRYPTSAIIAREVEGGWVFSGTISWVSGWGLNSAITVAAVHPAAGDQPDRVVTALVEVGDRLHATPLQLSAVDGSRTERVVLDQVFVPESHVLGVQTIERWRHEDLGTASDARAHHFGLARRVLDELDRAEHPLAREVAAVWRPRIEEIRARAYELSDEAAAAGGGEHRIQERLDTKVASGDALSVVTRALLVARSGRGLAGTDTAQLHARSALFILVQGQTPDVRAAQLTSLAR